MMHTCSHYHYDYPPASILTDYHTSKKKWEILTGFEPFWPMSNPIESGLMQKHSFLMQSLSWLHWKWNQIRGCFCPGHCRTGEMSRLPPDNDACRSTRSSTASDNPPPPVVTLLAPFWSAHIAGGRVNSVWATVSTPDCKWRWDIGASQKWRQRHYFRRHWVHVEKDKVLQSWGHFSGCYWLQMKLGILVFSVPAEVNSGWAMTISTCWPKPRIWSCVSSWRTLKASASTPNTTSSTWQMSSYATGCQLADTGTGSGSKMDHKWRINVN